MSFPVLLTDAAAGDLANIYDYIALHDATTKATHVLGRIEKALASLSRSPQRGAYPSELLALGIREYHEVFFKPYRIIYRVNDKKIYVLMTADGRRDMQQLLQQRLLGAE